MASMKLLKMDAVGRVRTPRAKRGEILDEFEGSGGERGGVRGAGGDQASDAGEPDSEETAKSPLPLEVELPGRARLRITDAVQVPSAVQLVRGLASC